jgi:hypothetical protein
VQENDSSSSEEDEEEARRRKKRIELTELIEQTRTTPPLHAAAEEHTVHVVSSPSTRAQEEAVLPHKNDKNDKYVRYFDDESASFYFYQEKSGKSTWVRPVGWKTPHRGSIAPLPTGTYNTVAAAVG